MTVAIDVDGLRIGYHKIGAGPAVVLLHGYVGDGAATWHRQLDGLGDEFRLFAWDAPGAGSSADPPESFGMAGYADCLAGFIAALGLRRAPGRTLLRWPSVR
jgi:pimeloyl-ACP methyl ester carboxylesterase